MMQPQRSVVPWVEPSPEKRSALFSPWENVFLGDLSPAAIRALSRRPVVALSNSTFFRCVQLKAGIIASLPVRLIDRATKKEAAEHPVNQLLQQPNSQQTAVEFWNMMLANYFTHGNGYCEKVISRGRVVELLPMAAINTNVTGMFDGDRVYGYAVGGQVINLPGRFVTHFRMFSEGTRPGLIGMSPAWAAEMAILTSAAQENMIFDLADNGGTPKMVIKIPPEKLLERINTLTPSSVTAEASKIQAQIEGARSRLAIYLPHGYDGTPLQTNFDDLQVQQTRDFAVADIARIMGVPLSKLGVVSAGANAKAAENENLAFYQDELRPTIVNLEKRLESDLLLPDERAKFQIKFNERAILRADFKTQVEGWIALQQQGDLTVDEIRDWLDLEPFGTPEATTPRFPVNMTTEQVPGGNQPTNPAAGGVPARKRTIDTLDEVYRRSLEDRLKATRAAKPMYADAVGRIVRKEKAEIGKVVRAALAGRAGTADIVAALTRLYASDGKLRQFIQQNIEKPVQFLFEAIRAAMEAETGQKFDEQALLKIVRRYVEIWAREYAHSSEFQIRDLINQGGTDPEILAAIDERLAEWEEKRAEKESVEETNRGRNVFAKALYSLAGVSVLRWVTSGSACPLCEPLDGRTFSPDSIPQCPLHRGCECSYTSAK